MLRGSSHFAFLLGAWRGARNAARKSSKPRPSKKTSSRNDMSGSWGVHQALGSSPERKIASGYVKIAIESTPFIVDLLIQNGDLL